MNGRQAHRVATYALSAMMVAIGVALIAQSLAGPGVSARLLLGVLFLAAGGGRTYLQVRKGGST